MVGRWGVRLVPNLGAGATLFTMTVMAQEWTCVPSGIHVAYLSDKRTSVQIFPPTTSGQGIRIGVVDGREWSPYANRDLHRPSSNTQLRWLLDTL